MEKTRLLFNPLCHHSGLIFWAENIPRASGLRSYYQSLFFHFLHLHGNYCCNMTLSCIVKCIQQVKALKNTWFQYLVMFHSSYVLLLSIRSKHRIAIIWRKQQWQQDPKLPYLTKRNKWVSKYTQTRFSLMWSFPAKKPEQQSWTTNYYVFGSLQRVTSFFRCSLTNISSFR